MKQYTLDGLESVEEEPSDMEPEPDKATESQDIPMADAEEQLTDDDYEYDLVGVLVHAGVAQGGHYYSFIKERSEEAKWYRFDDEDVTLFDPASIEVECFGGKVKKEAK
eukprot:CAMPEP_0118716052 /NCGR_PEP_ID=MMETSP0800-20121206/27275_1 /TAXON_ID=210618 ORGANISM="Striatella unipunctata, Strain CCMP2910" /NCGR_SAMPLE_ID=MMETSP0800 /ASSEMBLY_ACC=CAM_ASM_000638 /LENGTH=108 /DNA_ID=CAMNT_0006622407 /DNA_START=159 /DNA_END=482 /DNA_ORIENTATION=+